MIPLEIFYRGEWGFKNPKGKMIAFSLNYFCKKFHLRCLTGIWVRLWQYFLMIEMKKTRAMHNPKPVIPEWKHLFYSNGLSSNFSSNIKQIQAN